MGVILPRGRICLASLSLPVARQRPQPCTCDKGAAPDAHGAMLVQVYLGGDLVVLVAFIALHGSEVYKSRLLYRFVILGIGSSHEIDANISTVRGFELGEPEHPLAVGKPVEGRDTLGFVCE